MNSAWAAVLCVTTTLTFFAGTARAGDFCAEYAEFTRVRISGVWMAKVPESALGLIATSTDEVLKNRCANDPGLAYLALRIAELDTANTTSRRLLLPPALHAEMQEQYAMLQARLRTRANDYHARFPDSVQIATIQARVLKTVEAARNALKINPTYPPALAALAESLLTAGETAEAEAALLQIKDLTAIPDGYTLLARIRLARDDLAGAIVAARKSLTKRQSRLVEPDAGSMIPDYQANEVLGLAYLQQGKFDLAARALIAAEPRSEKAAALLRAPSDGLKRALAKLRYAPTVDASDQPDYAKPRHPIATRATHRG